MSQNNYFDPDKFIGYVSKVSEMATIIQIPNSLLTKHFWDNGDEYLPGNIGSYVLIEGINESFIGRIREINITEEDVEKLNKKANQNIINSFDKTHPQATIDVMLCFDMMSMDIKKGLHTFPPVASKVYICKFNLLKKLFSKNKSFDFATLKGFERIDINTDIVTLFNRHCAIVGNTGGGKSWTVAKILEEILENDKPNKIVLIDATGEYKEFARKPKVEAIAFGSSNTQENYKQVHYSYKNLSISDMITLLRPSVQSQLPRLYEAIRSLKLAIAMSEKSDASLKISDNILIKIGEPPSTNFSQKYIEYAQQVECNDNNYDITKLQEQIKHECIKAQSNTLMLNDFDYGTIVTLILRITSIINNNSLNSIFNFKQTGNQTQEEYSTVFMNFFEDDSKKILLISVDKVDFGFNSREILVDVIGRELLKKARLDSFREKPLVLFIDEAHQFLKKSLKDSNNESVDLNSIELIAKEGRKYGLYNCIITQMPRDIPTGVLSQMGTFIIHRLIDENDIEKVRSSCSFASRWILGSLPNLSSGEAIISSINLDYPMIINVKEPKNKPTSFSPLEKMNA